MQLFQRLAQIVALAPTHIQQPAAIQHLVRFVFCLLIAWACLGWDWSTDSVWALQDPRSGRQYRLGQPLDELNLPEPSLQQEMTMLDEGLLLSQRDQRVTSLTVLRGPWKLLCDGRQVGVSGTRLTEWEAVLGPPRARYVHPEKQGSMHYYRAALADIALLVDFGQASSVVLMEPGRLEPALERTGYSRLPQAE